MRRRFATLSSGYTFIASAGFPIERKWGARASGVWFAASRHKLSPNLLTHQTVKDEPEDEPNGGTPLAARGTRTLPTLNANGRGGGRGAGRRWRRFGRGP